MHGIGGFQSLKIRLRLDGRQSRSFAGDKPEVRAQRLRQQQNVGEQNRGIKSIAADRLQRDLGRQFGIVTERQEIPGLRTGRPIFRQVASRLAHHPDWWRGQGSRPPMRAGWFFALPWFSPFKYVLC